RAAAGIPTGRCCGGTRPAGLRLPHCSRSGWRQSATRRAGRRPAGSDAARRHRAGSRRRGSRRPDRPPATGRTRSPARRPRHDRRARRSTHRRLRRALRDVRRQPSLQHRAAEPRPYGPGIVTLPRPRFARLPRSAPRVESAYERHHIEGQRPLAYGRRRAVHAAPLRAAQRSGPSRSAVRLRARPVRRLRGDHQRRGGPIVCDALFQREERGDDARGAVEGRRAQPGSARVDRRTGAGLRLLPERADHHRDRVARQDSEPDRRADPRRDERDAVPLHDVLPRAGRNQARSGGDEGGPMRTFTSVPKHIEDVLAQWEQPAAAGVSRRTFLKGSGLLVVTVGAGAIAGPFAIDGTAQTPGPYPDPDFRQLDSSIVVPEDDTATFFVGKTDCGQGTGTAFRQMMADELDIAYEKTSCVMGSTDITVDQGGSGGSDAIQVDGWPMRRVAAEARRVLLEMAAARLAVPVDRLAVRDAVITVTGDPSKRVTYGELIGGRRFNVALTGANIDATTGVAKVKPVQALTNVGQSPQRYDIPAKVDGSLKW